MHENNIRKYLVIKLTRYKLSPPPMALHNLQWVCILQPSIGL